MSVERVAAIPVGMRVWAPAEAITMKKRHVTFRVEARDKEESRSVRAHMSVRLSTKCVSGRGLCKSKQV